MVLRRALSLAILLTALGSTPAFADITGFIGTNTTPENRRVTGLAVGGGLLIVGFEFEYGSSPESADDLAPSSARNGQLAADAGCDLRLSAASDNGGVYTKRWTHARRPGSD